MAKKNIPSEESDQNPVAEPSNSTAPAESADQKAAEYLAGWQRAQADLVNYRKRADDEKKMLMQFAHGDMILQLLPVLDNFKRAAQHVPPVDGNDQLKNWVTGVQSIEKQFEMILQSNGVTQIVVNPGDPFDPNKHEAITSEESDQQADTIIAEIEPGYLIHDKVLRPTKVKVAK